MAQVYLYGSLRRLVANWQLDISGATVGDVLCALTADVAALQADLFEADGVLRPHVRVLVNGQDIQLRQGLATPLQPADQVRIFPPIAGG